jgi:peptidoglycan hydrolase-like protein with peptidoglycan-binding domain
MYAAMMAVGMLAFAGAAEAQSSNMNRSEVRQVQRALNDAGYDVAVDGAWGPNTRRALRDYQQAQGLNATGRADRDTLAALNVSPSGRMSGSSGVRRGESPSTGGEAGVSHMGSQAKGSRTKTDTLTNPSTR